MIKLAVFDFDSTLIDGECINIILEEIIDTASNARDSETLNQLHNIRKKGMRGELDLKESLEKRIIHFEGLSLLQLQQICQNLPWMLNAKETITELKKRGYITVCLSGAFRTATRRVITDLGIDAYCCNTLEVSDGYLTGKISGALMHHHSKGNIVEMIQRELGILPQDTIAIGDGANDLSMFAKAHKKISFCAESIVAEQANCVIETKDLSKILNFID